MEYNDEIYRIVIEGLSFHGQDVEAARKKKGTLNFSMVEIAKIIKCNFSAVMKRRHLQAPLFSRQFVPMKMMVSFHRHWRILMFFIF